MLAVPGYGGFRRANVDQDLLSGDVHVTERDRHAKFSRAASSVVYGSKPEAVGPVPQSLNGSLGRSLKPTDFKVPKQSRKDHRQPMAKAFIHRSMHSTTFPDYMGQVFELREHSEKEYEAAFKRVDTDRSGYIVSAEVRQLLREVLGKEPSDHQVRTLLSFFDSNEDGRISLAEFKRGMNSVSEHLMKQTRAAKGSSVDPATGAPAWAPQPTKKVIGDGPKRSTMETDVGTYGDDPRARALVDGTGMYGTTRDLYSGTSKVNTHLPGYAGYMSESTFKRSERARAQSKGAVPRDFFLSKTNLDQTFLRRKPGYTGYQPVTDPVKTMAVSRPMGQFAATESDAADAMVAEYWAARNEAAKEARAAAAAGADRA